MFHDATGVLASAAGPIQLHFALSAQPHFVINPKKQAPKPFAAIECVHESCRLWKIVCIARQGKKPRQEIANQQRHFLIAYKT